MISPSSKTRFSIFFLALVLPATLFAATNSVENALTTPDSTSVTRGDFIRASIQVLGIPMSREKTARPRRTASDDLQPYMKTALSLNALTAFGSDTDTTKTITRGEAVQVLVALQKLSYTEKDGMFSFTDIANGSSLQKAVAIALTHQWMSPESPSVFGVKRGLTGADARQILSAVLLDKNAKTKGTAPTSISIPIRDSQTMQLPKQDMLRAVWQLMNNQYLYKDKLSQDEAAYKAAEALVNSANDPYTVFMRPANAKEFSTQMGGEVTGIGAQVEYKDNIITVIAPISTSPAEKAGIKAGDQIIKVDGVDIKNIGFLEGVAKIRGPKGSTVILTINRNGNSMEISVVRDTVKVPEVDVSFQKTIVVVKLAQFGETTDHDLRKIMADVATHKPTGVILDLRNNPGGLLHAAETVLSNFLPEGTTVAHIVSRDSDVADVTNKPPTIDAKVKMVVLVNKGSASASEIVAGALQDTKRATILGETTFGKGTVQQILEFKDGSNLKMTIAKWLTANRNEVDKKGITPDIIVHAVEGRDEQMLRALALLR